MWICCLLDCVNRNPSELKIYPKQYYGINVLKANYRHYSVRLDSVQQMAVEHY